MRRKEQKHTERGNASTKEALRPYLVHQHTKRVDVHSRAHRLLACRPTQKPKAAWRHVQSAFIQQDATLLHARNNATLSPWPSSRRGTVILSPTGQIQLHTVRLGNHMPAVSSNVNPQPAS